MPIDAAGASREVLQVAANSHIFFGHQSVGSSILAGLSSLFDDADLSGRIIETHTWPADDAPCIAHAHIGSNGDPVAKLHDFATLLDGQFGDRTEFALLKFCYADIISTTDVSTLFERYVQTMQILEHEHPAVTFIYATAPLTTARSWKSQAKALLGRVEHTGPADNVARHQFNELVRERYGGTGRLFDIAAMQSNNAALRRRGRHQHAVLDQRLAADAGHLNEVGSRAVATELARVIAANASA